MFDELDEKQSIFRKFDPLAARRQAVLAAGQQPFGMRFDEILSATRARVDGREVLLAGTNNYLGLTYSRPCIDAARDAVEQYGTATTGSRLANGTYGLHEELERELAGFFDAKSAIIFTTGYQANLAAISAPAGKGDHLLIDADSHACIYDACRLSEAATIRFRHNSPEDLNRRLARLPAEGARLVVVEGLYSMLGDVAPRHLHGRALSVYQWSSDLGGAFGPAAGLELGRLFGYGPAYGAVAASILLMAVPLRWLAVRERG